MALLGGQILNFADIQKRMDPKGMPAKIAELLAQSTPIVNDILWKPSNLPTSHRSTIRTGLPTVNLRRLNQGSAASKSTTAQIEDGMSLLDAWSHVDAKVLELSGYPMQMRFGEGRSFIEAMGQKFENLFFYGDETDDDREFNGLQPRYTSLGDNVLSAGGTGSELSSVYLVGWGDDKVFGIYPEHCAAGIKHKDHGERPWQESTDLGGSVLNAYVDQWCWDAGLVVKDHRYVVRIAEVDATEVLDPAAPPQSLTDYTTNLLFLMAKAMHRIPNLQACRPVFYMPRTVFEGFDVQVLARTTANVFATAQVDGQIVTTYRGIPIKVADQLGYAEGVLT